MELVQRPQALLGSAVILTSESDSTGHYCKEPTLSIRAVIDTKHAYLFIISSFFIFYSRGIHATRGAVVSEVPTGPGEVMAVVG